MAPGPDFVYGKEFINSEYGAATWEAVLTAMSEGPREIWAGKLLAP